jgi:endonuclease I
MLSNIFHIHYMKYNKLRPILFDIYNNKNIYNTTLEHVIPQSIYKKQDKILCRDLHNIILYPAKVNMHRSNFKYISDFTIYEDSIILDKNGNIHSYDKPLYDNFYIKNDRKKYFLPSNKFKGDISRAAMYFLYTYPKYRENILRNIIDPYTILTWHHQYPVSEFELYKNYEISKIQGNENLFINQPQLLVPKMEYILQKDLPVFDNYKY